MGLLGVTLAENERKRTFFTYFNSLSSSIFSVGLEVDLQGNKGPSCSGARIHSLNWQAWHESSSVLFGSVYYQIDSLYYWLIIPQSHINCSLPKVPLDHQPLVVFPDYFLGSQRQRFSNPHSRVFVKQCLWKLFKSHKRVKKELISIAQRFS